MAALRKGDSFRWQGRVLAVGSIRYSDPVPGKLVIVDSDGNLWPFGAGERVDLVI